MKRTGLALIVLVGCSLTPARADTVPLIEGLPPAYTPGEDFTFTVRVPEAIGLIGYRLDLLFTTEAPDPPLIAFPTFPTNGSYPFGTANASFSFTAAPGSSTVGLTISDAPRDPADITPGVNDRLATITVSPGAGLTGSIVISVGDSTIFRFQEGGDISGFGSIEMPQAAPTPGGNPVPAPPGVVLLALGGLLVGSRARLTRRAN